MKLICAKCNGRGYNFHYGTKRSWSEPCNMCNGTGLLGEADIDIELVSITKQEYEELLEYKHMYEDLCT